MAVNKVSYGTKTLIDLTKDTVTESSLLSGHTAHKSDGTTIRGKLLADFPDQFEVTNELTDASGNTVTDSAGSAAQGAAIYRRT